LFSSLECSAIKAAGSFQAESPFISVYFQFAFKVQSEETVQTLFFVLKQLLFGSGHRISRYFYPLFSIFLCDLIAVKIDTSSVRLLSEVAFCQFSLVIGTFLGHFRSN
jgi:hypothetical protein